MKNVLAWFNEHGSGLFGILVPIVLGIFRKYKKGRLNFVGYIRLESDPDSEKKRDNQKDKE